MDYIFPKRERDLVLELHFAQDQAVTENFENERTTELVFIVFVTCASIATLNNLVIGIMKSFVSATSRRNGSSNGMEHSSIDIDIDIDSDSTMTKTVTKIYELRMMAYRCTNLIVNLGLGLYGIYHYMFSLPSLNSTPIADRISGFDEYAAFGAMQVGYNIWSLFIGAFLIQESKAMMGHHIAVVCVGTLSAFLPNGFRYHAPFFFGVIEISSVPLAIMNFCRDKQEWAQTACPKLNASIKPIFSVVFLLVRIILWVPQIKDVMYLAAIMLVTCQSSISQLSIAAFLLCVVFLTLLQFFWATLIVKGIWKIVKGTDSTDSTGTADKKKVN